MSCAETEEHGGPYEVVAALRSWDQDQIGLDWHDWIIKKRIPGKAVQVGEVFRPTRAFATGLQYRCTVAGITSGVEFQGLRWPKQVDLPITDGGATWVSEAASTTSIVSPVTSAVWIPPSGITLSNEVTDDFRYAVDFAGGTSGNSYECKHHIELANGWKKEGVVVVPVLD